MTKCVRGRSGAAILVNYEGRRRTLGFCISGGRCEKAKYSRSGFGCRSVEFCPLFRRLVFRKRRSALPDSGHRVRCRAGDACAQGRLSHPVSPVPFVRPLLRWPLCRVGLEWRYLLGRTMDGPFLLWTTCRGTSLAGQRLIGSFSISHEMVRSGRAKA